MKTLLAFLALAAGLRAAELVVEGEPVAVPPGGSATIVFPSFPADAGKVRGPAVDRFVRCDCRFAVAWDSTVPSGAAILGTVTLAPGLSYESRVNCGAADPGPAFFPGQHWQGTVDLGRHAPDSIVVAPSAAWTVQPFQGGPTDVRVLPDVVVLVPVSVYRFTPAR